MGCPLPPADFRSPRRISSTSLTCLRYLHALSGGAQPEGLHHTPRLRLSLLCMSPRTSVWCCCPTHFSHINMVFRDDSDCEGRSLAIFCRVCRQWSAAPADCRPRMPPTRGAESHLVPPQSYEESQAAPLGFLMAATPLCVTGLRILDAMRLNL